MGYNKIHNITGAKNTREVYENIYDSIYPVKYVQKAKNAIDIGTGAGYPGLILAMAMSECNYTLIEPISKKSSFLHLAKSTLGLKNVKIENKRVEECKPFKAELITSRAVTNTKMLLKLCRDFTDEMSVMFFYKSESVMDEVGEGLDCKVIKRGKRRYLIVRSVDDF